MITAPVYGDSTHLACKRISVRFKDAKFMNVEHSNTDHPGAFVILVHYNQYDGFLTLTYVNPDNMVLKRLCYARDSVLEYDMHDSVCRVVPTPKPVTNLREV